MKKPLMQGIVVGLSFALLASAAWAGKAEVEKKAKEAIIPALSFKEVPVDKVIDLIAEKGGIVIKKVDIPKDAPAVTFEAKFISALEAVKIVASISDLKCAITDNGIEVSRKTPEEKAQDQKQKGPDPFGQ
ncbi:MAG: hypothetical protein WCS01_00375 [bacterium]